VQPVRDLARANKPVAQAQTRTLTIIAGWNGWLRVPPPS